MPEDIVLKSKKKYISAKPSKSLLNKIEKLRNQKKYKKEDLLGTEATSQLLYLAFEKRKEEFQADTSSKILEPDAHGVEPSGLLHTHIKPVKLPPVWRPAPVKTFLTTPDTGSEILSPPRAGGPMFRIRAADQAAAWPEGEIRGKLQKFCSPNNGGLYDVYFGINKS